MGYVNQYIKLNKAVEDIITILADWNAGRICVVFDESIYVRRNVPVISLDNIIGTVRNLTLAARNEPEFAFGIPEQKYPVEIQSDDDSDLILLDEVVF